MLFVVRPGSAHGEEILDSGVQVIAQPPATQHVDPIRLGWRASVTAISPAFAFEPNPCAARLLTKRMRRWSASIRNT